MILNSLNEIPEFNDVIIIGSGPAGITTALQLEEKGISSIIFEAGDLDFNEKSQNFYKGNVIGDEYPDLTTARLRQFGGTSGHWGGNCTSLDSYDFQNWPISKTDLQEYETKSYNILNIEGNFYKKRFNNDLDIFNLNWSNVRFKEKYYNKIKKSKKISLILNCPVVMMNGEKGVVHHATFLKDKLKNIKSKYFVLSTGGIENSRLLLWFKKNNKDLLDNKLPIGNYWMDHPYHSVAEGVLFKKNFDVFLKKRKIQNYIDTDCNYSFFFSPNKTSIDKFDLLNSSVNIGIAKPKSSNFQNSKFMQLKCLAPQLIKNLLFSEKEFNHYDFNISILSDQKPSFKNRIELASEKDSNGIPIPNLYWEREQNVRNSSKKIIETLAKFLIDEEIGRLAAEDFLFTNKKYLHQNGYHHMGGTRMGNKTNDSVVNADLKVHYTKNLFINGSSVFSTAGHAYPTLTITQLALRLGDNISKLINQV